MTSWRFLVKRTEDAKDLPLPSRMTAGSAGLDLYANIKETALIEKGGRMLVPTGICIALPFGFEAQVRPRSGLALSHGVTMLNSPGTVDPDYRGQLSVLLVNLGDDTFPISRGDRIAQLVIVRFETEELVEVDSLPETNRGTGGYGSTGS